MKKTNTNNTKINTKKNADFMKSVR